MVQGIYQHAPPFGVGEQIVFEIGIAPHHPHIAQHLEQHACRTPGLALATQCVQHLPRGRTKQTNHDLAVGKRGVVVRNFPEAGGHGGKTQRKLHFTGYAGSVLHHLAWSERGFRLEAALAGVGHRETF